MKRIEQETMEAPEAHIHRPTFTSFLFSVKGRKNGWGRRAFFCRTCRAQLSIVRRQQKAFSVYFVLILYLVIFVFWLMLRYLGEVAPIKPATGAVIGVVAIAIAFLVEWILYRNTDFEVGEENDDENGKGK